MAWQKNGGTAFFETEFFVLPEAELAFLITGNAGYRPLEIAEEVMMRALIDARRITAPPLKVQPSAPSESPASIDTTEFSGVYGNHSAPLKVELLGPADLRISRWGEGSWQPYDDTVPSYRLRSDGWWGVGDGSLPHFSFDTVDTIEDGRPVRYRYLIMRFIRGAGYDYASMPLGQKLTPRAALPPAWSQRLGTRWLLVNDPPESVGSVLGHEPMALETLPELPGYILLGDAQFLVPINDDRAGMTVKVPLNEGRDLNEIAFLPPDGGAMRIGSGLYQQVCGANGETRKPAYIGRLAKIWGVNGEELS